jgi:hypothetical protein
VFFVAEFLHDNDENTKSQGKGQVNHITYHLGGTTQSAPCELSKK